MNKHILLLFFSFCACLTYAQDFVELEDNTMFLEKMKEISSITKTIQCQFTQEKELSFMEKKMKSSGQLYFSDDSRLRWEYLSPYSYAILMVDEKLVIIDEGEVNETKMGKNPAFQNVQKLLTNSLRGDFVSDQEYFEQSFQENDEFYRIHLIPKDEAMSEFVSHMDVYFSKVDFMVSKFVMDEHGDLTTTVFTNQKINEALPKEIFNF